MSEEECIHGMVAGTCSSPRCRPDIKRINPEARIVATFDSQCPFCFRAIKEGEMIAKDETGSWGCVRHFAVRSDTSAKTSWTVN